MSELKEYPCPHPDCDRTMLSTTSDEYCIECYHEGRA